MDKSAIRDWLSFGDFDVPVRPASPGYAAGQKKRNRIRHRRNAPTDRMFQYWVQGKRNVEPLHHRLQARFVQHLKAVGLSPIEDDGYIDVQYTRNGKVIFAEIKPTENVETRYAIRAAIGQLLEYRFVLNHEAELEIVIGKQPKSDEIAFVKAIGLSVTYYDTRHDKFVAC